jgi:hypothetical protein
MKKIYLVFVVIIIAVTISFAATFSKNGVTITFPQNWNIIESGEPIIVIAEFNPAGTSVNSHIVLDKKVMDYPRTAEEEKEIGIANLENVFPNIKLLESKDNYWIYDDIADDEMLVYIQYYYVVGDSVYTLTCSATQGLFNSLRPIFTQVERSLVIRK